MTKVAVVLCNLGGPDSLKAVKPFLKNLFADPAILPLPRLFRWALGSWIVHKRLAAATDNYRQLGGASPLLQETEAQADALQARLLDRHPDIEFKTFISMRYWHPMAAETVQKVKDWQPDRVVILPLYPHYSTTTSESSILDWLSAAKKADLTCPHVSVCCYPTQSGWIHAVASTIEAAFTQCAAENTRLIFSAHGLPQSIVDKGDPYPSQIEATVEAVVEALHRDGLDWVLAYQSRVGPQKWIEPYLETELAAAGQEGKGVIVVPIAFVSEHSETLVELDIEYAEFAHEKGIPQYIRTPTVNCDPHFIGGLANVVTEALDMPNKYPCARYGQMDCRLCSSPQAVCALQPQND
jgi:ferrochelatase